MQARWEQALTAAEAEAPKVKEQAKNAPSVTEQAQQAKDKAKDAYDQAEPSPSTGQPAGGASASTRFYDQGNA